MADEIKFDFSELDQLAAVLGEVPKKAGPFINSAIQVTSVKVKKAAQASVRGGSPYWKALPGAIDYTVTIFQGFGVGIIKSEIGYNLGSTGRFGSSGARLGNIREFGAPAKNRAPHNDLANALEENQADFQKGLEIALADGEKAAGL